MIVVTRTDTYTIYRKRNQRYAVKKNDTKQWLAGDEKVAVLLAHSLVLPQTVQAPDHPEPPVAAEGEGASEDSSGEAPQ